MPEFGPGLTNLRSTGKVTNTLDGHGTCCDAVKGVWQQIVEFFPLVHGWTTAVDIIQCGIGVVHPLHQPLEFAVAYQVVAT